jgi:glycosyltransferase involved in cell wall biosynthesis
MHPGSLEPLAMRGKPVWGKIVNPKVSVIIPVYNGARFLGRAIESVVSQTYPNWELIVVDDGSTDETLRVLSAFGSRLQVIRQENLGQSVARNTGMQSARGEYIAFLDSDDMWDSEFLETMVSVASQHPQASVYYCSARLMDAEGRDLPQLTSACLAPTNLIYKTLLRANFLIVGAVLIRRSAILAVGLFDPSLRAVEDWDLWLRLARNHVFVGIPKCLVRKRLHSSSLSTDVCQMRQAIAYVVEKHFGPDDGQHRHWAREKRLAYGGAFRYNVLTSVLPQNDWRSCAANLRKALVIDPTLSLDLDLFYELALGTQPTGYRGTSHDLNLEENAKNIKRVLEIVFSTPLNPELEAVRRQTYGSAFYALGLAGYNTKSLRISRSYLHAATRFRPELWLDLRLVGDLLKSLMGRTGLEWIRYISSAKYKW